MPLFAKVLVFLNILATGAFIYLASLAYGNRQAWAQANFQLELTIDGLPLDERDPGRNVTEPVWFDLGGDESPAPFVVDMFKGAGKKVVTTQKKEVEHVRDTLNKEFVALDKGARRNRIRDLLLAQARTYAERREVIKMAGDPNVSTDDLEKKLMAKFDQAVSPDTDLATNRRSVAHLLYNLDPSIESHQRLMIIVGLKAAANVAEEQARALRDMIDRTNFESVDDRLLFEAAYQRNRDRILELVRQYERQQSDHLAKQRLVKRIDDEVIKPQAARIEQLKDEKVKVDATANDRLKQQAALEDELFQIHRQMSNLLENMLRAEREIRERELGRNRGGRQ